MLLKVRTILVDARPAVSINRDDVWIQHAACRDEPPATFYRPDGDKSWTADRARQICAGCPVRIECLQASVARCETFGVWGGAGGDLRRTLRRAWTEGGHGYRERCGCVWCAAVETHMSWLDDIEADRVAGVVHVPKLTADRNGDGATHGKVSTYGRGCRCGPCKAAKRRSRDAAARRLASGEVDPPHGRLATYQTYGCRCDRCSETKVAAMVDYRRRRGEVAS